MMTMDGPDELWTTIELARVLRLSPSTLYRWRAQNRGPAHLLMGGTVRYTKNDVVEWVRSNHVDPGATASSDTEHEQVHSES